MCFKHKILDYDITHFICFIFDFIGLLFYLNKIISLLTIFIIIPFMRKFYEKIRDIRKLNGFSQEYVSYELGLSQSQYSRRENGVIEFSFYEVDKLCKLFKINTDSLAINKNTEQIIALENIEINHDDNKNKIIIDFIMNTFDLLLNNNFSSEDQIKIVNDIKAKLIQK